MIQIKRNTQHACAIVACPFRVTCTTREKHKMAESHSKTHPFSGLLSFVVLPDLRQNDSHKQKQLNGYDTHHRLEFSDEISVYDTDNTITSFICLFVVYKHRRFNKDYSAELLTLLKKTIENTTYILIDWLMGIVAF